MPSCSPGFPVKARGPGAHRRAARDVHPIHLAVNRLPEEEEPSPVAALARCAHPRIRLASSAARRNWTDGAWARWPLPDPPWPWDSPGPTRTLHQEEYQSIKIGVPFPRVHSSLLDLPGSRQEGLHRRRSTRPWDFSPSLTMCRRLRGRPRRRQLRSVSRHLVRVSKDRPFTVFKSRSPLPRPHRCVRFGERQPAALVFRLRGFSPPGRLTPPRPSPNFRRSSSRGVRDVSCGALPRSPSRGPTLRSLAPRKQPTDVMPKHRYDLARVTRRVSPSVHRVPCPLALGLSPTAACLGTDALP